MYVCILNKLSLTKLHELNLQCYHSKKHLSLLYKNVHHPIFNFQEMPFSIVIMTFHNQFPNYTCI